MRHNKRHQQTYDKKAARAKSARDNSHKQQMAFSHSSYTFTVFYKHVCLPVQLMEVLKNPGRSKQQELCGLA